MRCEFFGSLTALLRVAPLIAGLAACTAAPSDPVAGDDPDDDDAVADASLRGHRDGRWTRLHTTGSAPSERSTPAVAAIGRRIYVFGGSRDDVVNGDVQIYDDLHRFDTATRRWDVLTPAGPVPPPRVFAASVAHPASRRMLVFGGAFFGPFFSDFAPYGDLWAYDVDHNAWHELHPSNPGPGARSRPSAWMIGDKLYLFGGITAAFQVLNDLWVYDLHSNAWTELVPLGAAGSPPPRHEAAVGRRGSHLVIYGGEAIDELGNFLVLPDTWEYSLTTGAWTDVTPAPAHDIVPPRNYGAAVTIGDGMYLQGGDTPGGDECGEVFPQNPTEQLWRFDLRDHRWRRLFPGGDPLARIKRINSARVAGAMYIVGGFDFRCDGPTTPNQIWNHDIYRFEP
jgi:hypothetical protein